MQAIATAEIPSRISHDKVLVIFGGLLLVMLLAALDSTIVATALPTIVNELGGLAHLSWVVTAYLLAQNGHLRNEKRSPKSSVASPANWCPRPKQPKPPKN